MNEEQKQIIWKILLLIAMSGKGQPSTAGARSSEFQPGISYADFQVVSGMDIKKAQVFLNTIRIDMLKIFQQAPTSKLSSPEDRKKFLEGSQVTLGQYIGLWCKDLPAWWFELYAMGLHVKMLSVDLKQFTLYPAKTLFNAIVKALSEGATLLSPVQLTANRQMPLFVVLLEATVPPQLLAELIVSETNEDVKAQCIEQIICFLRIQVIKFLSPLHEFQAACFLDVSLWIDILSAAESRHHYCYFQSDVLDMYAEKIVAIKLGELVNGLLIAMTNSDKAKVIEELIALKSYYDSLPERFQDMKTYVPSLTLYQALYLPLLRSDERDLKQHAKWYLSHLVPSYPTNRPVGFVVGMGAMQYVFEQLEHGHFELAVQMLSSLPNYAQRLVYFGLLQKLLSRPQTLAYLADYYQQQHQTPLLKAVFRQLIIVAKLQETVNTQWFNTGVAPQEVLSLEIVESFLMEECIMKAAQLRVFLLKGFEYFQFYQTVGILWFIWLKSLIGTEALFTASKQLGVLEAEAWFSQRFAFLENPHQAGLVDEALAARLFFTADNMALLEQGDDNKITALIKSLRPSMPNMTEQVALQMVNLCPSFSVAKKVLAELIRPNEDDDIVSTKLLIHAAYTNQLHILTSYAETTDKETIHRQMTSPNFLEALAAMLYVTAEHSLDLRTYQLPESFKLLSTLLVEEKIEFDLPEEESAAFQRVLGIISIKGSVLKPLIGKFLYLIKYKSNLMLPEEQKLFEQVHTPTAEQLDRYLYLIHRFINLEEQDIVLAREISNGIYQIWMQINRKDRAQVRRFLLLLVDLINCIDACVPKKINPAIKQISPHGITHNNYQTLTALITCLFYQLHQRGFDDDVGIIARLRNHRLRRDFISAHLVRLILCKNFVSVKKMQQHFKTQINYAANVKLTFEIEDNLQGIDNSGRFLYYQTRKIFPLVIGCENSLDFPFKQIDKLSITLEIITETGKFNDPNIRKLISVGLKDQMDHYSELSVLMGKPRLFLITDLLIDELILKGDLSCVQLALETFDVDKDLEISKKIINTAIIRFSVQDVAIEKHTALKIIKLLLNVIHAGWDYFASQRFIDNRNGAAFSIVTLIRDTDMELFGLLYDFFVKGPIKPDEAGQITITLKLELASFPAQATTTQIAPVSIEPLVAASYQKYKLDTTTMSLARMQGLVEKMGLQSEGDIDKFIKGYLAQANDSAALSEMGTFAKPSKPPLQRERLFNASYFKGTWLIQNDARFYPIRKSQVESYVYFNPDEIAGLVEPTSFQSLCHRISFVGRTGEGLKYLGNLKFQVAAHEIIEGGYEMKIHGSKERLLCYLAPSDHPDNPNVYVACLYLEDGLHGRIDPNKPFNVPDQPSFGMPTLGEEMPKDQNLLNHQH